LPVGEPFRPRAGVLARRERVPRRADDGADGSRYPRAGRGARMRWQRAARWGVAVAGLGIAALLYFQTDERPPDERPPVATPADPEARAQSAAGTVVRFSDG